MELKKWAFGGVMISIMMSGLVGFISTGLNTYDVAGNSDSQNLEQLKQVQNSTSIAKEAQQRAQQAEARTSFFYLPQIVGLLKLPFQAIPVWQTFLGVSINVFGLEIGAQWLLGLAVSYITITISFRIAAKLR